LVTNLRRALRGTGYARVRRGFGRVVVDLEDAALTHEAARRAANVFGVANVGVGRRCAQDLGEIKDVALGLMRAAPVRSFAVRARRTYARLAQSSHTLNAEIGQHIVDATGAPVDLTHPDVTLRVELFGTSCIVYRERLPGPGGLPVGTSGRMLALLSGGIDSPVAAWRMARRGAVVDLVHFHGQPFTDRSSTRQVSDLARVLAAYQLRTTLHLVPLADAQREIVLVAPSRLRVVLYRRMMLRIAASLARDVDARAIVLGDSLGQVASQTIENISAVDAGVGDVLVLRPLVGMDKQEIVADATRIGTYEVSTRRYQDCCVLFEPRAPTTKARPTDVRRAEAELDVDSLAGKAIAATETRSFELAPP
jgi:thiamine biosynthesis protein ThiI